MNNILILGKAEGSLKELSLWLFCISIVTIIFFYHGYINDKISQMVSSITTFVIFAPYAFFAWRNKKKNSFIEIDESTLSIRNAFGMDRFLLEDIDHFRVKKRSLVRYISFAVHGHKRWYFIGTLKPSEINELNMYAEHK